MDDNSSAAYAEASRFFVHLVASVPDDAWDAPGLGDWTIRDLVGHANRAHTLVEEYVVNPVAPQSPDSDYFTDAAIAQRGRDAVAALSDEPAAAVADASRRAIELIRTRPGDTRLGSPAGTMTLSAYLPSRVAELIVHAIDLRRALSLPDTRVPDMALAAALEFVASRAVSRSGEDVLLALSGRAELPEDYSVF